MVSKPSRNQIQKKKWLQIKYYLKISHFWRKVKLNISVYMSVSIELLKKAKNGLNKKYQSKNV